MDFVLTLVRHGESTANVQRMLSGWMDVSLTENGKRELEELRDKVGYPQSEIIFSSPLTRALDTAHILFPGREIVVDEKYKEINFRSLEGAILSSAQEVRAYFTRWIRDERVKDEETLSDIMARGRRAILDTVKGCEEKGIHSAIIVMHSGIIRASIVSLFNLRRESFLEIFVPNGLGYILTFNDLIPTDYRKLEA